MTGAHPRWRAWRRATFVGYALVLATLTHWPHLSVAAPHGLRLDLFIHVGAFGAWLVLLTACGWFGPPLDRGNVSRCTAIAFVYAVVDELTQGIPALGRTAVLSDLVANAVGIVVAATCLWWLAGRPRKAEAC